MIHLDLMSNGAMLRIYYLNKSFVGLLKEQIGFLKNVNIGSYYNSLWIKQFIFTIF